MFKKILLGCVALSLAGCALKQKSSTSFDQLIAEGEKEKTKTAVILPLSGDSAALGDAFRNAILMAQLERGTDEVTEVDFYDSKGTKEGAKEAFLSAERKGADIVLGPVFSKSVEGVKEMDPNIPVISFTSDTSVLGDGVYSMALLIEEQIKRITKFACERGEFRFALLGPNDKTGAMVLKSFETNIQNCPGMQLSHISLYDAKNPDLTAAVAKIAPPLLDLKNKNLTEEEKLLAQNPTAERIEFDALFIFEQGVKLQQLISLLGYYDVTSNLVPFYGLATLRGQASRDLVGAYFADLPQAHLNIFKQNYKDAFAVLPVSVSALGYDAISLVSYLSQKGRLNERSLLSEEGYAGVNGRFRFNEDGTNDRLLEMFQIRGKKRIIKVAPTESMF